MSKPDTSVPALEARDLSVARLGRVIVRGVTLAVGPGECLGIAGANASGKSTLLAALSGWVPAAAGMLFINGREHHGRNVPREVGYAPQALLLYPKLSARQNLRLYGSLYGIAKAELEKRMDELVDLFELRDLQDQPALSYSPGVVRRVHLAIALIHRPSILLMDEPTLGLDPPSRSYLLKAVGSLLDQGTSVVITGQQLKDLEILSHRLMILVDGEPRIYEQTRALMARLGVGMVEVALAEHPTSGVKLDGLPGVESWELTEGLLNVRVSDHMKALPALMAYLEKQGLMAASIEIRPPSLEQLVTELHAGSRRTAG